MLLDRKLKIMRNIILLLILTFGIKFSHADCGMNGMQFYPEQKEISLNPMFIIQGYSFSQKTINSFKERKIYLESESGELITLNLREILKGEKQLTQAIFYPISELKQNTTYFLKYSDETENEVKEMMQYNSDKKARERVFWKTTDKKNFETLNSSLKIIFKKNEVIHYGCGPSVNALFDIENKTESEIWYKTEVIEIDTNKKTVFYIMEWKEKLNVGHGMCSGAFVFNRKSKYKVRFTPMNTDGQSLKTTNWINIENPFLSDKLFSRN